RTRLDAALLGRPAAIVRDRGDIRDRAHDEAGGLHRTHRTLTARPGALHKHVHLAHVEIATRGLGGALCGELTGERRRLATALETGAATAGPAQGVALQVRNRHNSIIERRM